MLPRQSLHEVQANILRMLRSGRAGFSQLNAGQLSNDHFTFHLKQLQRWGLIDKPADLYSLTTTGKELASRLQDEGTGFRRQPKVTVLVVPVKQDGDQRQYLAQQRLRQPFYGYHGFMTGAVQWGEPVLEAAARVLKTEAGLVGNLLLLGIQHKTDFMPPATLLEDRYFFVVRADNPVGELRAEFSDGRNLWLAKTKINELEHVFPDLDRTLAMAERNGLEFFEEDYNYSREQY